MNIAVLNFTEKNVPNNETPLTYITVIETSFTTEQTQSLAIAISNVKEHADWGESLSEFNIPENWEDYGWNEKMKAVCEHMADYVGFKIIDADLINEEVN